MNWLPVLTKRDFVRRYAAGEFGNAAPTWNTLEEFVADGYSSLCHLRNRVAGGATYYNQEPPQIMSLWPSQADPASWYCSAMAPTPETLIQGEVMQRTDGAGLYLYYSRVAQPMRNALHTRAESATGIIAVSLLRSYLDANSYDWINELLLRYPGHVVEFSTYARCWGTLPGYNTIFWEVRNY